MDFGRTSSRSPCCWFHGSSFKGSSVVFLVFWLAKVESSQKSNRTLYFRHFFAPYLWRCNRNNMSDKLHNTFWRGKMFRKPNWSFWNDSWSMEPTIMIIISTYVGNTEKSKVSWRLLFIQISNHFIFTSYHNFLFNLITSFKILKLMCFIC